ncbi:2-hydroxyacyl-CoA dehydratase subunit D [Alteromonas lipolytica]|uniref:2-hydroxyglutaryl-CoA dehydratase n=1 Tax=Alteromonas lipolytica TaxID=1856405 RepID=A0A1E8FC54_9ALTE|nr:2-hydroxyacyl-CoA dehydratase family protein [Alteromonas lipolytica]OFI33507.1 hypothetical protein BFC17_04415 [Alteromonas lipolytica]GGF59054.1 hypothetical protein GCM10011338_09170 [Alteromonas lipolytica]
MNPLERLKNAYYNREEYARQWHASGRKVVGYVCDNVPAELFTAAGMLPYRLSGKPQRNVKEVNSLLGSVHTSRLVGTEFIDTITASLVAGELDFIDYLVVPHNRKNVQALGALLLSTKQNLPDIPVPEFYYLDRTYLRNYLTSGYNRKSLMQLVSKVESWTGNAIDAATMRKTLEDAAQTRSLLREVNALRGNGAPKITGVEALEIYGAAHFMPTEEFQQTARAFIEEAKARPVLTGKRLYMGGSPLDNPALYALIEQQNGVIVAEDHCWGARCAEQDVNDHDDPFEALAARFVAQPACSLLASIDDTTAAVVRRALNSGAQGAIFNVINGDKSQMWETPSQFDQLREQGLPCLHLKRQPYNIVDPAPVSDAVAQFLEQVASPGVSQTIPTVEKH